MLQDLIFDGGFSTQLISDGYDIDNDPLWSARLLSTNGDAIVAAHKRFLEAGADAIISSSYQASLKGFRKHLNCTNEEAARLMALSGKLIKRARNEFWEDYLRKTNVSVEENSLEARIQPICCASLGPYGACLADGSEYTGSYMDTVSKEELVEWHDERLSILAKEDLDLYLFETIPALGEAKAVTELMKRYPKLKFAISFSCKDGTCLSRGETFKEAVEFLNEVEQVVAVGINCTSPQHISSLLESVHGATTKKILVKPNNGLEWTPEKSWSGVQVVNVWKYVEEWKRLGANWIGGCCTVGIKEITEIRKAFKK